MQRNQIDQDHYVVEKIVGKRIVKEKVFYKVKWEGYSESQCTWQKKSHLRYVTSLIEEFQNQEAAFSNAMKSSLGSYEDSSEQPLSLAKNSIDVQNGSRFAKQSKSIKKGTQRFESTEATDGREREEIQLSSYENKDSTSQQGQSCQAKKAKVKEPKKGKQGKKAQKSKKVERKRAQASKKSSGSDKERLKSAIKPIQFQQKVIKGEQTNEKDEKVPEVVIRLLQPEGKSSDINDYVVIYRSGKSKIYNTWELFYAHPVEFVGYLESKAKKGRQ